MARTKTAERREAILAAAREVFQEVGFDRASMDEIAARFGGSKVTLYRYFENKETLFKELISRTANEMDGGMHLLLNSMGMKAEKGSLMTPRCKSCRCLIRQTMLNPPCGCLGARR